MSTKKKPTATKTHATVHAHNATATKEQVTMKTEASTPPATTVPAAIQPSAQPAPPASGAPDPRIQRIITTLSIIPIMLGSEASPATPMTIEERRAQPKMKKGGAAEIPAVLNLADQYGIVIPGGGTDEARADLQLAANLLALSVKLGAMSLLVDDAISEAKSRAWDTTTTAYGMLIKLVKRFPALQKELDPMASFMARKHKDAPTVLRQAESKTLSKTRATLKAKKDKAASAPVAATQAAPAAQTPAAAPATPEPSAGGGNGTPIAPSAASTVIAPAAGSGNGVNHS